MMPRLAGWVVFDGKTGELTMYVWIKVAGLGVRGQKHVCNVCNKRIANGRPTV